MSSVIRNSQQEYVRAMGSMFNLNSDTINSICAELEGDASDPAIQAKHYAAMERFRTATGTDFEAGQEKTSDLAGADPYSKENTALDFIKSLGGDERNLKTDRVSDAELDISLFNASLPREQRLHIHCERSIVPAMMNDDVPVASATKLCIVCKKPATQVCSRCNNSPLHFRTDGLWAYYCSRECQKSDRKTHKDLCDLIDQRKALYKVAQLLKDTFVTVRQQVGEMQPWKEVTEEGNTLFLSTGKEPFNVGEVFSFDGALVQHDPKKIAAILMRSSCEPANTTLTRVFRQLLSAVDPRIQVWNVGFVPKNLKLHVRAKEATAITAADVGHVVYMVRLTNMETYVIDPTAQQYGWDHCIMPWFKLEEAHIRSYLRILDVDYFVHHLFQDSSSRFKDPSMRAIKRYEATINRRCT